MRTTSPMPSPVETGAEVFLSAFTHAPIGMALVSPDGWFLQVNPALTRILGYGEDELLTMGFPEITHPEDLAEDVIQARQVLAGELDTYQMEKRYLHRDGRHVETLLTVSLVRDGAGEPLHFIAQIQDISQRKRFERELLRSNSELERFAYVASHDLQEPLRMVTSYCQLLQRRYEGRLDGDADDFIRFAVDGATRMQALIDDLLVYSRVGRKPAPRTEVDLNAVVADVLWDLRLSIEEADARVVVEELPTVTCNARQIAQVLQNLVGNAVKFRGDQPPLIRISARTHLDGWTLTVRDNGIGLDPRHAERIFEIFQRLNPRQAYEGTGVGLAIVKRIVETYGGCVWVESEPGAGSAFRFWIPDRGGLG